MNLLTDQVCIVTGAGQGLGRAIALEMASEGAKVALLERNPVTVRQVAAEISAKGGIIAFTKSMAVELGRHNILVNAVAPGFMLTPMSIVNGVDETQTPDFIEWYVNKGKVPLRRTGYPEDVSGTVIFLASKYCRYMTGQLLVVDGGLMSTF